MKLIYNVKTNHMKHAYLVRERQSGTLIYTGVDTLRNIITLDKISGCMDFNNDIEYEIEILGAFEYDGLASNAIHMHLKNTGEAIPPLNYKTGNKYIRNRLIYCNETGQSFLSQKEISEYFGIAQPNISKHLKRYPGHKTCNGKTFRYLNHDEGQALQRHGLLIDKNGNKL